MISGPRLRRVVRGQTTATTILLVLIAVGFVGQFVTGDLVTAWLAYVPEWTLAEPWRLVTYALVHGGIWHVTLNGYSLWVLGNLVERNLGTSRFIVVFIVSTIAGALAVLFLNPGAIVVGASAGIFGLFAALFVVNRGFGGSNVSLLVIIGINLVIGFIVPGISWQAHIGGLIGGLVASVVVQRRR